MAELKRKILISSELQASPVGEFFQLIGLECISEFKVESEDDFCFVVDDYYPEIQNIPRIKLDPSKTYDTGVERNFRGAFDQKFLENEEIKNLLKLYFRNGAEFNLIDAYSKGFTNITSIKMHEYLNVGYFIDTIVVDAYKNKFDYDLIRKYLNQLFEYSFGQVESSEIKSVLEVSYSFSENVFALEVSFLKENFNLMESFNFNSDTLKEFNNKTNYFDASYFTKRNKVTLSSLWFKNESLKKFKSYFFSELASKNTGTNANTPLILGMEERENLEYQPRDIRQEDIQAKKLSQSRKFALFIKNYRNNEENPKDLMSLELSDIDEYLTHYPRQEAISEIDDEVKRFILKLLQDEKLYNGITEYINKVANSNLDPQVEQIQRVLSRKSLADLDEIVRVKGVTDNITDESSLVKGWFENNPNEEVRIKGTTESITDEKWAVKRAELSGKIQDEIIRIKSEGRNIIQEDIIRVVSKEVNVEDPNIAIVVKEIIAEAISGELTQKSNLEEAFALKFISQQATPAGASKEKIEDQNGRMVKIITQMKTEIVKLRAENKALKIEEKFQVFNEEQSPEVIELKKALSKSLEMNKLKDKITQKLKEDLEKIFKAKDEKVHILEARIELLKEEHAKSHEVANEEKLEQVQSENKRLAARLELANRKINIINDNIDKQDSDANAKKDKEILTLKANIQLAQSLVEKLKQERVDLENKLAEEREKVIKLRDEKASAVPVKDPEKESLIAGLSVDKKILEEKLKLQGIEIKKIEQKLKFTAAQLEESQKRKAASGAASSKGNDIYIKQLEHANSRLAESGNELAEKKKELHKLKQENGSLNTRLAELERKLAASDKKAA